MLPRRRKPSPTGKVDRAQPGPDEGKQPKSEEQATLNGSVLHSMWPVSLLGCGPSSVRAFGPATFPVGEGDLPAGAFPHLPRGGRLPPGGGVPLPSPGGRRPPGGRSLTFPWGKVPPQRRKRGGTRSVLRAAPHPSRLRRATLSQERVGGPHPDRAYENVYRICLCDGMIHW